VVKLHHSPLPVPKRERRWRRFTVKRKKIYHYYLQNTIIIKKKGGFIVKKFLIMRGDEII
jgi:hypothetical protein